jgi:thioredoxin 1|tara:strand:+ start:132 stop:449 length:318 start_codon:yes stop_codon:yes gene_type:complete
MIKVLNEGNFKQETATGITLIDFYAEWCGPCKVLAPILESVSEKSTANIYKVDVEKNRTLAQQFGVRGIPLLVVMKDGKPVEQTTGLKDENTILEMIQRHESAQS